MSSTVYSVKAYSLNIKPINPVQKYLHIIELYACILKMFVLIFLFYKADEKGRLINLLFSFGICSTPKESK